MADNNKKNNAKISSGEAKPTLFHDFFGPDTVGDDPSRANSVASELGSEKQVATHLEGVPFYVPGAGSDLTDCEINYRSAGNKRSISDSVFMGSSRDGFQHIRGESSDGLHLMKMLRNAGGAEQPRRVQDEATFFQMNHLRPTSTHHLLGSPSGSRTDLNGPRWDRAIPLNVGPTLQQAPPRMHTPFSIHTLPMNRYKDGSVGPSGLSQSAADEGSRTGMKGSGILSSINGVPSGVLLSGKRNDFGKPNFEPESSASASRHGSALGSRQMTIFYGGQAHVFDDVRPNKGCLDLLKALSCYVIMAVAGSNEGSWSTSYGKSDTPLTSENFKPNEAGMASKHVTSDQFRRNLSIIDTTARGFGSGYQISVPPVAGGHQRDIITNMKHGENAEVTGTVQKRKL